MMFPFENDGCSNYCALDSWYFDGPQKEHVQVGKYLPSAHTFSLPKSPASSPKNKRLKHAPWNGMENHFPSFPLALESVPESACFRIHLKEAYTKSFESWTSHCSSPSFFAAVQEFNLGIGLEEPRGEGDSSFISAVSRESQGGRLLVKIEWFQCFGGLEIRSTMDQCFRSPSFWKILYMKWFVAYESFKPHPFTCQYTFLYKIIQLLMSQFACKDIYYYIETPEIYEFTISPPLSKDWGQSAWEALLACIKVDLVARWGDCCIHSQIGDHLLRLSVRPGVACRTATSWNITGKRNNGDAAAYGIGYPSWKALSLGERWGRFPTKRLVQKTKWCS